MIVGLAYFLYTVKSFHLGAPGNGNLSLLDLLANSLWMGVLLTSFWYDQNTCCLVSLSEESLSVCRMDGREIMGFVPRVAKEERKRLYSADKYANGMHGG